MSHPQRIALLSVVSILAAAAFLSGPGSDPAPDLPAEPVRNEVSPEGAAPRVSDAAAVPRRRIQAEAPARGSGTWCAAPGAEFEFRIRSETDARIQKDGQRAKQGFTQSLTGRVRCRVLDRRDDELVFALGLSGVELEAKGASSTSHPALQELAERLGGTTLVRMRDDGRTLGYRFPSSMQELHKQSIRGIVDSMRHVFPGEPRTRWQTEEAGAAATARVAYSIRSPADEDVRQVTRKLLGFVTPEDGGTEAWSTQGRGQADSVFDARVGWLRSTAAVQEMAVVVPQMQCVILTRTSSEFHLVESRFVALEADEQVDWSRPWEPVTSDADPSALGEETLAARYRKRLADRDAATCVGRISSLVAQGNGLDSKDLRDATQELMWLLRVRDAEVPEMAQLLLLHQQDPVLLGILADAMAAAGTPACQRALFAMVGRAELGVPFRQSLARAMLYMQRPTPQSLASAASLAHAADLSLGRTGMILYGALLGRAKGAADHVAGLASLESHAREKGCVPIWLLALGNAKDPALDRIAERYLAAEDAETRRAAIEALRHSRDPALVERLRGRLQGELLGDVRCLLVDALALRGDLPTILDRMRSDPDANVRRCALVAAARFLDAPGVRHAMRSRTTADPSGELRTLAGQLLATP